MEQADRRKVDPCRSVVGVSERRWPAGGRGQSPKAEMTVRTVAVEAMIAINKLAVARNANERVAIGAVGGTGRAAFTRGKGSCVDSDT